MADDSYGVSAGAAHPMFSIPDSFARATAGAIGATHTPVLNWGELYGGARLRSNPASSSEAASSSTESPSPAAASATATASEEESTQSHSPGRAVAAQLRTETVSVQTARAVDPAELNMEAEAASREAAAAAGWSEIEPEDGVPFRPPTKPRRPEVGETPTPTSSAATLTAFSTTPDAWEWLLRPTKTARLPALIAKTPAPPAEILLPRVQGSGRVAGGPRLDPFRVASNAAYRAPELEALGSDGPGKIAEDVWALVESLTLEEKIGQMTQVNVGELLGTDGRVNATAVEFWVDTMKIGAVVGSPGDSGGQYAWYSAQLLANVTNAVQQAALARGSRVPVLWGLDAVRGASLVKGAAMFPTSIGLAATFDPHHAYTAGRVAAKDTRAAGYQCAFGPCADIAVDKRWGQTLLSFGEDPALAAEMVAHAVRGYQGDYKTDRHRVACCLRGFVGGGGGQPSGGRMRSAHHIPDAHLLEYHLPGFEAAVAAGAAALMHAPGAVNGEAVGSSPFYLRTVLRDRLRFRGVMVADQQAVGGRQRLRAAEDPRDAVFLALNNTSIDFEDNTAEGFAPTAAELVRSGRLAEERITESCARILQLKKDLGLFDHPYADPALPGLVGAPQDITAAQNAVRDSLTLLRNNGILPLAATDRVLFVGPYFNSTALLGGGWNVHAQGPTPAEGDAVFEGVGESILSAVHRIAGPDAPLAFHRGFQLTSAPSVPPDSGAEFAQLVRLARQADKIVVALGEVPYSGQGADLGELGLDPRQIALVRALHREAPRPLAVVLVSGRPRLLKEVGEIASAVLHTYLPGALGGQPVAEALYGKFSPSGRLPVTYPRFESQAHDTMWQGVSGSYAPAWPFGAGLGYSRMSYSNLTVSADSIRPGRPVTVSVVVHNHGPLDQKEPVMLFTSQQFRTGYEPEFLRMRAFHKPTIRANSAAEVAFTVSAEELAYYNRDLRRVVDPSKVNITINALSPNQRSVTVSLLP
ncbi:hypothetical protein H4R19_002663 [Coemansia spiralis]|nr:hypothetical protein H4R19_002663 [Coemansia spiralis]